jgi:hypothetical protein
MGTWRSSSQRRARSAGVWSLLLSAAFSLAAGSTTARADSRTENSTYYVLSPDLAMCPTCGSGVVAKRANRNLLIVAELDLAAVELDPDELTRFQEAVQLGSALVRGDIVPNTAALHPFYVLHVTEVWLPATQAAPAGRYFRVRDNGIVCITTPCFSFDRAPLNTWWHAALSSLDLLGVGADAAALLAAQQALFTSSLMVSGRVQRLADGGVELSASQFFLRADGPPARTSCGPFLSCDRNTEVCRSRQPIGPAIVYDCVPVPSGCESDRSCACAAAALCTGAFAVCRDDLGDNRIDCECPLCQ